MKKIIFIDCLILFFWIIVAVGSIKVSYHNLSDIQRDGQSAVGKIAQMDLRIISQYDRHKFVAEDESGNRILLNFRGKVKASPEVAKRQVIDIGKTYFLAFEIAGIRDILPKGSSKLEKILKGDTLAIGFPHEVKEQARVENRVGVPKKEEQKPIVKGESGPGHYVGDKEKERYAFKKAETEPAIPKKDIKSIQPVVEEKGAAPVPWEIIGTQWHIGDVFIGGGSSENGSIWTRKIYPGNIHVGFNYYADTHDSEAILFIYGNGQDERAGYSFTLNPNWSTIRKNSFKEFLAHTDTVKMIPGRWYGIEAEVVGDQLKMFVDNNMILSAQDSSYSSGKVGFMVWWQATGKRYIKNIKIEKLLSRDVVTLIDKPLEEKKTSKFDKSRVVMKVSSEKGPIIPLIKDPFGIAIFILLVSLGFIVIGKII